MLDSEFLQWLQRAADDVVAQPAISALDLATRRRILWRQRQDVSLGHWAALVDKSLKEHKIDNLMFQRYSSPRRKHQTVFWRACFRIHSNSGRQAMKKLVLETTSPFQ